MIVFKQNDEFLINRVKNLSDKEIDGTHWNVKDMARRLKDYRTSNESKVAEPSVQDFFKGNNVQVFSKDAAMKENALINGIKIYIERIESPINYQFKDENTEAVRRIMVEQDIMN